MADYGSDFSGDDVESMVIEVRADTRGFSAGVDKMRQEFDSKLVDGFSSAGNVLEKGLLGAIRRGSLGFDDLKRVALNVLDEIASRALDGLFAKGAPGSTGGLLDLGGLVGSIFGLPGRATGGPVSPGQGYLVGERGPELFVPTSAGRIETGMSAGSAPREVRVSINVMTPRGGDAPQALQRSSRQVASAVRRALTTL